MNPEKFSEEKSPEVKKFSKEHMPEQRKQVAAEIKEKRREYFERKGDLQEQIEALEQKSEKGELKAEAVAENIADIRDEISNKERNLFSKIANFFEIRKLKAKLEGKEGTSEGILANLERTRGALASLQEVIQDRSMLQEARQRLSEFYGEENEAWREYQEDEKKRDLGEVMRQNDVLCVHAIHPSYVPGTNSILKKFVDWRDKFKITMALEPTVSTSTIKRGDGAKNLWAGMGVLLKGGRVANAFESDAATRVDAEGDRQTRSDPESEDIEADIDKAIKGRNPDGYNELVVQNPEIAGVFYSLDEDKARYQYPKITSAQPVYEMAQEYGLPLYVLKGGETFEAIYDQDNRKFQPGRKVSRAEIENSEFSLDVRTRQGLVEDILEDRPFDENKLEVHEARLYQGFTAGANTFMKINGLYNPAVLNGEEIEYKRRGYEGGSQIQNGEKVEFLTSIPSLNGGVDYFKQDNKVYERFSTNEGRVVLRDLDDYSYVSDYIDIGMGTEKLSAPVDSNGSYLSGVSEMLESLQKKWEDYQAKGEVTAWAVRFTKTRIETLAMHLHGYAISADEFGQSEIARQAREMADQYLPDNYYRDFSAKRVGPKGEFKLLEEDLPGYKKAA